MSTTPDLHRRAGNVLAGGISSVMRQFDPPIYIARTAGSRIWDVDGREYVDFHAAVGPVVLGHAHPEVTRSVEDSIRHVDLTGIGASADEVELAEKLVEHVPSAERVLFCSTGTEATFNALRLARVVTGRDRVIKFTGNYHGSHDYTAVATQGSGPAATQPLSPGVPADRLAATTVLPFNDAQAFVAYMGEHGHETAAVIVEPILHTPGCIEPVPGFLEALRAETTRHGTVLIFDEIISGIRHSLGGYQAVRGVTPDITTMSKALANGYPMAALMGSAALMSEFATAGGPVFFGGTFNGHPLGMRAALTTLQILERDNGAVHRHIFELGDRIRQGLREIWRDAGVPARVTGFGSVFLTYFTDRDIQRVEDLATQDAVRYVGYHQALIDQGLFVIPVNLKRGNVMHAHTTDDVDRLLEATQRYAVGLAARAS